MAENEEPELSTQLIAMISNAQLGRLIAEFRRHPLAEGEVREVEGMTGVYVSLSKSQPESFCLSSGGRMYFFFRMAPDNSLIRSRKDVRVSAELPGLDQKDVEVLIEDGSLALIGAAAKQLSAPCILSSAPAISVTSETHFVDVSSCRGSSP
jgi:hypothetical protein